MASSAYSDFDVIAQEERVRDEIAASSELVSDPLPTSVLLDEYKENKDAFRDKLKDVTSKYDSFRRVRGDGNCFYRAFGFALLQQILHRGTEEQARKLYQQAVASKALLVAQGYTEYTIEDFYDSYVEVIALATGFPKPPAAYDYSTGIPVPVQQDANSEPPKQLPWPLTAQERALRESNLLAIFRDDPVASAVVYYLRLLTAGHFKTNAEFFQGFIEDGLTVSEFCAREVEVMARECEQVHIVALSAALDVPVRVVYTDSSDSTSQATEINFQEEGTAAPTVSLLYRPGHYDILYAR
ncbi:peptidase C65 Otubain [Capsaspora owczarzaki ATCC 30864]|uniref:Ubiquitin thioesterase n=1 Tax=Capsaspora owczarzaki (strain ATCC 30864) TaxID=595528 RepID=A0A0D2WKL9_CAPO3|nr:peptidase C65 Otubain [Capsaspora owczarzaki ATCC 30864]KJE90158.1 peptidase C65 Otubain [Capsaspora owczarzaki ATCC 30864]|eukprot:XP_004364373.1 peptidase C65 Otubain [Capsaspora owczarzaki ATCC 30864]